MMRVSADAKSLAITAEVADIVPGLARGDAGRLRQILVNLRGNPVKFTEPGGITIAVSAALSAMGGMMLRFEARDTGVGIPANRLHASAVTMRQLHRRRRCSMAHAAPASASLSWR